MKLTINADERYNETEIIINCNCMNDYIEKLISAMRILDMKLPCLKDGQQHFIDIAQIIYIECVDKHTFLYTAAEVYESSFKLIELEEKLSKLDFLRASKNCLFNIRHLHSLKSDLEQKLLLTMENDIKISVSRQYSGAVKEKLEAYHG
ncbi:MAG: LytTR family transcriptional regulator DNA-binding domain-containing protein [Treponema sp.]|nr:LytTR family transcriptional regulator DNA-binding domain-containing protein [Treponema sp.]